MSDLDHRWVTPPYLRQVSAHPGPDRTGVWDLRLVRPNRETVPVAVMHSLEHFLGAAARDTGGRVMGVAPMGCLTGMYVFTTGPWTFDDLAGWISGVLGTVEGATAVPLANEVECGAAAMHSLTGAQEYALRLLAHRDAWGEHGSHEITAADLAGIGATPGE